MPSPDDYMKEFKRLNALVSQHRSLEREIVVVMGLGFVGADYLVIQQIQAFL